MCSSDLVAGGADFQQTAVAMGLATLDRPADLGWLLPPVSGFLHDTAKIQDMRAGDMTDVISPNGGVGFLVYRVSEREERRAYTDTQKTSLGQRQVEAWVKQQQADGKVPVTEDLSKSEKDWITKTLAKDSARLLRQQSGGR